MGKTNKCNLREDETLFKNTNVRMIKVFPDTKKETSVNAQKAVEEEIGLEEGSYCSFLIFKLFLIIVHA